MKRGHNVLVLRLRAISYYNAITVCTLLGSDRAANGLNDVTVWELWRRLKNERWLPCCRGDRAYCVL